VIPKKLLWKRRLEKNPKRLVNSNLAKKKNLERIVFTFPEVSFPKISVFPHQLIPYQNFPQKKTLANDHVHKNMHT